MMTAALLSLTSRDKTRHILEDFVSSSEILIDEMPTMNLQKPMIFFVFFISPMAF
jgi:hypothetical protein